MADLYVETLFDTATLPALIHTLLPRAYIDLNRAWLELDPLLITGPLPADAQTHTARVRAGLGVIPRLGMDRKPIYRAPLSLGEITARLQQGYIPYHIALHAELADRQARHGRAVLLDLHSMPSTADKRPMPDLVFGDRFGQSCAPYLVEEAEYMAGKLGFSTARNQPYAGGYITEHYGTPKNGVQALQIEINRALYMHEHNFVKKHCFSEIKTKLTLLVSHLETVEATIFHKTGLRFSQDAAE